MSNIDPTVPIYGFPTTASVRDNFQIAHDEISTLQAEVAALQGEVETDEGLYLPLIGGTLTGPLTIDGAYLDVIAPPGAFGYLTISRDAGQAALLVALTAGKTRWYVNLANGTAETGSAAGSDFVIQNFDDNGNYLSDVMMLKRSTGHVLIGTSTDAGYRLDVNATTGGARISVTSGTTPLMIFGGTVAPPPLLANTLAEFVGADSSGTGARITTVSYGNTGNLSFRAAAGTAAAPTAPTGLFALGTLQAYGYAPTAGWNTTPRATIGMSAAAAWTDTSQPTQITFYTTPVNGVSPVACVTMSPTGNLLVGTTIDGTYKLDVMGAPRFNLNTVAPATAPAQSGIWLIGANTVAPAITLDGFAAQAQYASRRANGTPAAPTALVSGNNIMTAVVFGYGATGYGLGAILHRFQAAENWTDTAQGVLQIWHSVPTGTVAAVEGMRLTAAGNLLIGTTTDGAIKLDCNGPARVGTFGANGTAPIAKPAITGAKASNAALASLLTALANYGLITDTTTA